MGIQVEAVFEDREINEFLEGMSSRLSSVKEGDKKYTGLLSAIVFRDVIEHFAGQQGSDGPWKQWSASYRKAMNKAGHGGNKILQWTGKLRQDFKPTNVKPSSAGPIWFNNAQTKSGFPYAFAHNEGGSVLPKRDFMWLSEDAGESIAEKTLQFMLDEGI